MKMIRLALHAIWKIHFQLKVICIFNRNNIDAWEIFELKRKHQKFIANLLSASDARIVDEMLSARVTYDASELDVPFELELFILF